MERQASCKSRTNPHHCKIASWNVHILMDSVNSHGISRPPCCTVLIAAELSHYDIDIAALSETRLPGFEFLSEHWEGYTFLWKGIRKGIPSPD